MLSEMDISSPSSKFTSSSIAQRRQARDGVSLDFRVQMPRAMKLHPRNSNSDEGDARLSPSCLFQMGCTASTNPITPIDQCGMSTPVVPKAPRLIDFRRGSFAKGRWLPTPTEGVLPTVALDSMSPPSPDTNTPGLRTASLDTKILSAATRPSLLNRSLSWLSYRQLPTADTQCPQTIESDGRFKNPNSDGNTLESPFESA